MYGESSGKVGVDYSARSAGSTANTALRNIARSYEISVTSSHVICLSAGVLRLNRIDRITFYAFTFKELSTERVGKSQQRLISLCLIMIYTEMQTLSLLSTFHALHTTHGG